MINFVGGLNIWRFKLSLIFYNAIENSLEYRCWKFKEPKVKRLDKVTNLGNNINILFQYDKKDVN